MHKPFLEPDGLQGSRGDLTNQGGDMWATESSKAFLIGETAIEEIQAIPLWSDYGGTGGYTGSPSGMPRMGALEGRPHNYGHRWFGPGSSMINDKMAAEDPIFWAHHGNLDRLWAKWQTDHPGSGPGQKELAASLTDFPMTIGAVQDIAELGYEYVALERFANLDARASFNHLVLDGASDNQGVERAAFSRVELRIHGMQVPIRTLSFDIFLNLPSFALSEGRQKESSHAALFTVWGHGECVGGPGHCDPKARNTGFYDLRPTHHLSPFNVTVDLTKRFKALDLAAGIPTVEVVARSESGTLESDCVFSCDSVSIVFID